MLIIRLSGGLGNQLFQYALGRKLGLRHKKTVLFDLSFNSKKNSKRKYLLAQYKTSIAQTSVIHKIIIRALKQCCRLTRISSFLGFKYHLEKVLTFDQAILNNTNGCWDGFWQSELYFSDIRNILIHDIVLKNPLPKTKNSLVKQIKTTNSVGIHIRRGDYVDNSKTNAVHGTCSLDYYHRAIKTIKQKIKNPKWFVFSDDIQWARQNLALTNATYLNPDIDKPYFDLELLRQCKHFIIANSSFSWWGAWLSSNPHKIVIAPKKWFNLESLNHNDIVPAEWEKI